MFWNSYSKIKTRITAQNIFFNLRIIDNRNKWKNYVIVTGVKLNVELDVLIILVWSVNREIISIHLRTVNAMEKILCANNIFSIYL